MSILNQIQTSKLSKQGKTNLTGVFEGTPTNVGAVVRGGNTPRLATVAPVSQNPVDVTYGAKPQPTYLDYLQASTLK